MSTEANATHPKTPPEPPPAKGPYLHRVCIQCNGMFRVTPDKLDVKQCPNCHKG